MINSVDWNSYLFIKYKVLKYIIEKCFSRLMYRESVRFYNKWHVYWVDHTL